MARKTILVAFLAWLGIAVAAIANGTLRQAVLIPAMGDAPAQLLSIAILVAVIVAAIALLVRGPFRDESPRALALIGASWAAGTVLFEFALGRLVLDMPWSELLAAYDVRTGSLWPLAPLTMLVGPLLARYARGKLAARSGARAPARPSR